MYAISFPQPIQKSGCIPTSAAKACPRREFLEYFNFQWRDIPPFSPEDRQDFFNDILLWNIEIMTDNVILNIITGYFANCQPFDFANFIEKGYQIMKSIISDRCYPKGKIDFTWTEFFFIHGYSPIHRKTPAQ